MTEFEQQVQVAIVARLDALGLAAEATRILIANDLAPRVATAIEAAGDAGALAEHTGLYGEKYKAEVQSAGLGGLRGDT